MKTTITIKVKKDDRNDKESKENKDDKESNYGENKTVVEEFYSKESNQGYLNTNNICVSSLKVLRYPWL